ncbi:MAG: carboxypeptidase regulatory-like domain-containing protein [Candidatus Acidiferrales bacterium]
MMYCLFTILPAPVAAQQTASLTGVVTDGSGAVIPGVEVTLTDTQTGAVQKATTNDLGVYLFVRVRPASGYTITFAKEGFKKHSIVEVAVAVNTTGTRNAMLEIGEVSAVVTVESAGAATINTTDATIGNAIETRRIQDLPLSLRNSPARLLGLQPGVVANTGGGANRDGAVTGARTDQGNITLDGLDVNDMAGGFAFTVVGQAPIDTIQEFRTVSANPAATDGRSGGAQITLVTKSGSNDWHGSARYFWRHEAFAANSFFNNKAGTPRPTLRRHQFGGNFSGPILRDRLFFFSDYEARRQNSQFTNQRTAPLQHVFNGSVAYVNDGPGCGATSTLQTAPSCITILTPAEVAMIDPASIGAASGILSTLSSRYPVGQLGLGGNGVIHGGHPFQFPGYVEGQYLDESH